MNNDFEQILQHVLAPLDEPDDCLNRKIMDSVKSRQAEAEMEVVMRKSGISRAAVIVVAAAAIVSLGGLTAHAAWKYLKPEQAVSETGDKKLAEVFRDGNSISVNERQSYGGYAVTLLGTISGENLSQYEYEGNGELKSDRTYAVVAIERENDAEAADGGMDVESFEEGEEFLVSPLIKGEDPRFVNIFAMNGAAHTIWEDGIQYRIMECDNLEIFAGRGVYLSVNQSGIFASEGYHFDEASGEITRNEAYEGLNALFQLPLDSSKADEQAAQEQLQQWEWKADAPDAEAEQGAEAGKSAEEKVDADDDWEPHRDWNQELLEKYAEILPETVETLKADKDGYIHRMAWSYGGIEVGTSTLLVEGEEGFFPEKDFVGMTEYMSILEDGKGKELIETYTKNEDGTITVAVYHEK